MIRFDSDGSNFDAEQATGGRFGPHWGSPPLGSARPARATAANSDTAVLESGQLRLVPGDAGRGLSMSLTPSWGVDPESTERLWAPPDAHALSGNDEAAPSNRLDTEFGYGLPVLGNRFTGTPNVGFGLSEAARDYRIGWRLTPAATNASGFEVNLDAVRRESTWGRISPELKDRKGATSWRRSSSEPFMVRS